MPSPNMGLTEPVDGDTANTWGAVLNACLDTIDAHDHTTGKGVQVPTAGLNINANLTFGSFAALNLSFLNLVEQAGDPILNRRTLYTKTDHNLWWFNNSGVGVQITSGNTLNVSIVGGIGGDYSSVGALLSYDDATRRYLLQQEGSPRPWAGLATADIDLYQKAASITNKVTLKSPAALAASYAITMPAALPASTSRLMMDGTGVLEYGDAVTQLLVVPAALAKNQAAQTFADPSWTLIATPLVYGISLPAGAIIKGWTLYLNKPSNNTVTITALMRKWIRDVVTNFTSQTNAANAPGYVTLGEAGVTRQTSTTEQWEVVVSDSSAVADQTYQLEVSYLLAQ